MYWVHNRITRGRFKPKWIFKCDDDNLVDIYSFEKYAIIQNSASERLWPYFGAALAGGRNVRGGVTMSYYYSVSLSRAYLLSLPCQSSL